jgi:hypothetical protein
MKGALWPLLILGGGYVLVEGFLLHKAAHRLEPMYLYEQYVAAGEAMARCGDSDAERLAIFVHNRAAARDRVARELADSEPAPASAGIDSRLQRRSDALRAETAALVGRVGCDHAEVKTLLKRFEIRSRRRIG